MYNVELELLAHYLDRHTDCDLKKWGLSEYMLKRRIAKTKLDSTPTGSWYSDQSDLDD